MVAKAVEILVQSALAGVVAGAQLRGCPGKALVGIVADGAVGHGREHHRQIQLQLGLQVVHQLSLCIPVDPRGLLAQKHLGLHGLPQGIDGRIGDLRSVDQELIPVYGELLRIAHGAEQHTAGICLFVNLLNGLVAPVGICPERTGVFDNFQRPGGTQGHTALTVDAFALIAAHELSLRVKGMHLVGALPLTNPAGNAAVFISDHIKFRVNKLHTHQNAPSFTLTITGSPPAGAQICSASGSIPRMAASSLAMNTLSSFSPTTMDRSLRRSLSAMSPPS